MRGALAGLARVCYRCRRLVLLTWIVGVIAVAIVGFGFGAASDNDFSGGDSDSAPPHHREHKRTQRSRVFLAPFHGT